MVIVGATSSMPLSLVCPITIRATEKIRARVTKTKVVSMLVC